MKALLVILFPFIELFLFIEVGAEIGALTTILLIIFTALIGWTVLKFHGLMTLPSYYRKMMSGADLAYEMIDSFVLVAGGLLLLIPGFLTDAVGALCLVPLVRRHVMTRLLLRMLRSTVHRGNTPRHKTDNPDVIEGEYRRRR